LIVIIVIAVTKKNQRLGDIAANTVVVNTKSQLTVQDTVFMNIQTANYKVAFNEVLKLTDRDINTIKSVITSFYKTHNTQITNKVATKIKDALNIQTNMYDIDFLEKLLEDYNYLATKD
jgi:translation elongation factor EF-1alpha